MPWTRDTAEQYLELGSQRHVPILDSLIDDLLGDLAAARVLDFGCGPGRLTARLARRGAAEVVGVDENRTMIETARATADRCDRDLAQRIRLEVGDEGIVPQLGRLASTP
jgi:trans-aconitate methyltransferase